MKARFQAFVRSWRALRRKHVSFDLGTTLEDEPSAADNNVDNLDASRQLELVRQAAQHVVKLEALMQQQGDNSPGAFHSRSLALIQSSGSGKSRLLHVLQRAHDSYIISRCLRGQLDTGTGS